MKGFIVVSASGITLSVVTRRASYCSLASISSSSDSVRCGRGGAKLRVYSLPANIGSVGDSLVSSIEVVYGEECESWGPKGDIVVHRRTLTQLTLLLRLERVDH